MIGIGWGMGFGDAHGLVGRVIQRCLWAGWVVLGDASGLSGEGVWQGRSPYQTELLCLVCVMLPQHNPFCTPVKSVEVRRGEGRDCPG